jgi:dienelactone hydrolase
MTMLLTLLAPGFAAAQEEIPPPSGKGRVVVVLSGATGSGNYRAIATRIAALGYNVVLYDSPALAALAKNRSRDEIGGAVIAQARQMPHSLPGKIGLVGFSMGGGVALTQGTTSNDVAVVAAWYPATIDIKDPKAFASRLRVPVVMFAGTEDDYKQCCMIDKAREIASAAKALNAPFELTIYPGVKHGFNIQGANYSAPSTDDALAKTAAALQRYLGG